MNFSYSPARLAVLALSCLPAAQALAQASSVATLRETVVTAARMPQDPSLLPQGVQVITAAEIQASGVATANEAIRWLGGVVGRIDSGGGRDQTLDLRGFGETASSNVVFLVDGVRQNEGDSSGVALSWIPVESIERIEIVRGSGSVLHGEGATAGTINIITRKGLYDAGKSVSLGLGSLGTSDMRASLSTVSGAWRFQLHGSAFDTDNHRDNFSRRERNALARATWVDGASQVTLQLGGQSALGGLPGGITPADVATNPRKTYKPQDSGRVEKYNLQLSGETQAGVWRLAADLSHRTDRVGSTYVADGFSTDSATQAQRASVRGWRQFAQPGMQHRLLVGLDAEEWSQDRSQGGTQVDQASQALYVRHEIGLEAMGAKVHAGARRTASRRDIAGAATGSLTAGNTSWELGAAQKVGQSVEVFGRWGTSFRLANADEFACYPYPGGPACPPVTLLKPQTSRDTELGYRDQSSRRKWSARYYRSDLVNEIGFDPNLGNTNFDPTRRQGVEIDAAGSLGPRIDLGAQVAHREAVFRGGPYAGRTVPMVPAQSLTARLSYRLSSTQQVSVASQWVSSQRITDDFSNSCTDRIPGYGTVNVRYSEKVDLWTFSAVVNNLTDKRYYNYRTRCDASLKSVYPEAGRTLMLTAQRRF